MTTTNFIQKKKKKYYIKYYVRYCSLTDNTIETFCLFHSFYLKQQYALIKPRVRFLMYSFAQH